MGPGTVIALAAAVYLIWSGWLSPHSNATRRPDRIAYQADAQGRLQQVHPSATPPASAVTAPGLWKPEVGLLLESGSGIRLQRAQRDRLAALNAAWSRDRARVLRDIRSASAGVEAAMERARSGRGAALTQIRQDLGGYSALSREYDALRADYWARGLAVLTPQQRKQTDAISHATQGAKR